MKHKAKALVASLLAAVLLAGCSAGGSAGTSGTSNGSGNSEQVQEKVELNFLSNSMYLTKANDEINESLQKQYPYLSVNIEHVADNYEAVLKTKLQTGGAPDLYNFTTGAAAEPFVEGGQAMNLSDTGLEEMLLPSFVESGQVNGEFYCVPISLQSFGLLYNKDCFEKAGIENPPRTISELKEAVDKLNAVGIQPFASPLKDMWACYQWFWFAQSPFTDMSSWYTQMNAGEGTFDNEGTRAFFEVYDMIYENCGANPLSSDYSNMCQMVSTGEAAMSISGDFAYAEMMKFNPEANLGLTGMPISENPEDAIVLTNVTGTFISEQSEHKDAAVDFCKWMLSKEGAELLSRIDGAGTTAASEPELELQGFAADGAAWINEGKRTLPSSWNYWAPGIMDVIGKDMQAYFAGSMTLDQMFADLDSQWPQA